MISCITAKKQAGLRPVDGGMWLDFRPGVQAERLDQWPHRVSQKLAQGLIQHVNLPIQLGFVCS